jgi:hypothetical protein
VYSPPFFGTRKRDVRLKDYLLVLASTEMDGSSSCCRSLVCSVDTTIRDSSSGSEISNITFLLFTFIDGIKLRGGLAASSYTRTVLKLKQRRSGSAAAHAVRIHITISPCCTNKAPSARSNARVFGDSTQIRTTS